MKTKLKAIQKRWVIIIICTVLVLIQQIWTHIQFNTFSIGLIIVAALLFIFPEVASVLPDIKRIKLWEAELEMQEKAKELSKDVHKITKDTTTTHKSYLTSYIKDILYHMPTDPITSLVLITTEIDRLIRSIMLKKTGYTLEKPLLKKYGNKTRIDITDIDGKILIVGDFIEPTILQSILAFLTLKDTLMEQSTINTNVANSLIGSGVELLIAVANEEYEHQNHKQQEPF